MKNRKSFNFKDPIKSTPKKSGVYVITNTVNFKVYVGSSKDVLRRITSHRSDLRRGISRNKNLQKDYDKYGEKIFTYKYCFNCMNKEERYIFEEKFISLFVCYNIATEPTKGGSPNKGKKLSKKWIENLHKNNNYKHPKETLKKVSENNKKLGCKLIFKKGDKQINFSSWKEASIYFNTSPSSIGTSFKRNGKWRDWSIFKNSLQKKKVLLYFDDECKIFNSAGECDRFLGMWVGATSHYLNRDGEINGYKVKYL